MRITVPGNQSWNASAGYLDNVASGTGLANLTDLSLNDTTSSNCPPWPHTDPETLRYYKTLTLGIIGLLGFLIVGGLMGCLIYKNDKCWEQFPCRKKDDTESDTYVYSLEALRGTTPFGAIGVGLLEQSVAESGNENKEQETGNEDKTTDETTVVLVEPVQEKRHPEPVVIDFCPLTDHYHTIPIIKENHVDVDERVNLTQDKLPHLEESNLAVESWLTQSPPIKPQISVHSPRTPAKKTEPSNYLCIPNANQQISQNTVQTTPSKNTLGDRPSVRKKDDDLPVDTLGTPVSFLSIPEGMMSQASPGLSKTRKHLHIPVVNSESEVSSVISEAVTTDDEFYDEDEDEYDDGEEGESIAPDAFHMPRNHKNKGKDAVLLSV